MNNRQGSTGGFAVICDRRGAVTRVIRDDLGVTGAGTVGGGFAAIVGLASAEEAVRFIDTLVARGAVFDWQLNAAVGGRAVPLDLIGAATADCLLIIGATSREAAQGDGLARLNHDLTAAQRELVRKNAELQRTNAELQETRVALEAHRAELLEANARLEALATRDSLTGVMNRRAFQERLGGEFRRAARYYLPLSLMMLDIDDFKPYNDAFGHPAGDEALRAVAQVLIKQTRDTDCVARYGGEEFAVILTNTELADAASVAERLRRSVQAVPWPRRPITIGIGVAAFEPGMAGASYLVSLADQALYAAKQSSRNRVSVAPI